MAHLEKYTRSQSSRIIDHCERKNKHYSNENIDIDKSYLNYSFTQGDGHFKLQKRLSEVKVLNRKDVNVMCSWVITLPQWFKDNTDKELERVFFKRSFDFLKNRYGEENIVFAKVHYDETTPHLHFAFIPVIFDNKKQRYKCSAKEVVNRLDLMTFHKDFEKEFEIDLGIRTGITNSLGGNRTVKQLKSINFNLEKSNQELKKINMQLVARISVLNRELHDIEKRLKEIQ